MYRLHHRPRPRRRLLRAALRFGLVAILLIAGVIAYLHLRTKTTIIGNAKPLVTSIGGNVTTQTFDEADFTINLPTDWKLVDQTSGPYDMYSWQEQTKYEDNRILNLYVDTIPAGFAVNKLLPLKAQGAGLIVGELSDDCSTFTGPAVSSAQAIQSQPNSVAKWQGVNFICDLSHYNRNAAGTGSTDGINTVRLTGPSGQTHAYFFVYTDENIQPDYSIFENALSSFHSK